MRTTAITLLAALVVACTPGNSPESTLKDYLSRVENVLEVEGEISAERPLALYPRHRERRLDVEEVRIGVLDALSLMDCGLLHLISERNAVSGKVMAASQRLLYEIRFLAVLRECPGKLRAREELDEEVLDLVLETLAIKERNLRPVFWAATFDGPEMEKAFSLANDAIQPEETAPYIASRQALEALTGIGVLLGGHDDPPDSEWLENHLRVLSVNELGGRLVNSQALLRVYLNGVASALERAVADRPFCHAGRPNRRARILDTVFRKFFAGRVGLYVSQVHRQSDGWRRALAELLEQQPRPLPAAFQRYWRATWSDAVPESSWSTFEEAIDRHTKTWKTILGQCGLMPGERGQSAFPGYVAKKKTVPSQ